MIRPAGEDSKTPSADVRTYFDRAADSFDRLYHEESQSRLWRWINRRFRSDIFSRYLHTCDHIRLSKAQSVLDVGCGSGRYLSAFAKLGVKRMVGIDLSQPMLDLALEQVRSGGHRNTELIRTNFDDFKTDERFDVVVAMGFFDYQSDPVRVLEKMRSLVRHSVIVSFPSRHWFRTPLRQLRYRMKKCPVFFYDSASIAALAEKAGYTHAESTKLPGPGMDYVSIFRIASR